MQHSEIIERLHQLQSGDVPTHGGHTLAYVYDSGLPDVDDIGRQAMNMFASSNGLDPTVFPSLLQMERGLVATARTLLTGPDECVGTFTSGGTESILLAVQAARDASARIARPAMIAPATIHAAFAKAAHYFGVELIKVDVDPHTRRAAPAAMQTAVQNHRDRLVLVAGSAPSYAHGVIDPIPELAAIAEQAGVRFHVDACIGGWVLPWAGDAGMNPPPWDFRVSGVTSISVDLHKYAYTPKGASLLLHRNRGLRRSQYFAYADWPGYTMLNSTTQSTKSGAPLAAAWAVVNAIGQDRYRDLAVQALRNTERLAEGVRHIGPLSLAAEPESTLVAAETDETCDVFTIADSMADHGWYVQPQMSYDDMPASLHMSVSAATDPDTFVTALSEAVAAAVAAGPAQVPAELARVAASIDPVELDDETFDALMAAAGLTQSDGTVGIPSRMAPINALLDTVSPALRETLLVSFLDRLMGA